MVQMYHFHYEAGVGVSLWSSHDWKRQNIYWGLLSLRIDDTGFASKASKPLMAAVGPCGRHEEHKNWDTDMPLRTSNDIAAR